MAVTVVELHAEALLLSDEARIELAERLIESCSLPSDLLSEQLVIVQRRMENLDAGLSREIPGEEAHLRVLRSVSA
ncbi:addiction module protein [Haloferula sp. BvORR071]|uniref:addiction module protein n=1 Tax=Haloferula sp. BvORR071 TaxID=1396141 RepID=UPI00054FC920|nr:addiction module protein [Haloferula sp. BvORR071]